MKDELKAEYTQQINKLKEEHRKSIDNLTDEKRKEVSDLQNEITMIKNKNTALSKQMDMTHSSLNQQK